MSKIDELIKRFCPDGVQFKELGQVGIITIGEFVHKNKQNPNGKYPVYNGGTSYTGHYDDFNNTANKIVISARGANAGFVNKVIVDYWAGNSCYSISFREEEQVNWLFAFYYLKHNENKLIGDQQKGGIPAVSKKMVQDFLIPIPPLAIQEEIVNILDTFTTLEAELEAELEARKKQYTFYRDSLLSFEGKDVEWKTLGEVAEHIASGKNKLRVADGQYPIYGSTGIIGFTDVFSFNEEQLLVARVGANAGLIQIVSGEYDVSDNTLIIEKPRGVELKFLYYLLIKMNLNQYAKGGGQPLITAGQLKTLSIPLPSLHEQRRIVSILDKFDIIVNDISSGLPAEIEARRKQYEHYRNQLLTFKEVVRE